MYNLCTHTELKQKSICVVGNLTEDTGGILLVTEFIHRAALSFLSVLTTISLRWLHFVALPDWPSGVRRT